MRKLRSRVVHTGHIGYFAGDGCAGGNAMLVYANYYAGSSWRDIVDEAVCDFRSYDTGPEGADDLDIREAIVDGLSCADRAAYKAGDVAACAIEYTRDNNLAVCRVCGADLYAAHESDCSIALDVIDESEGAFEEGDEGDEVEVVDEDCDGDDDNDDCPCVIFRVEWDVCQDCGEWCEHDVDALCHDCSVKHGYYDSMG